MDTSLPNFIIIGAMKCATSTLHVQLSRQPGFFMSEPKEPNFFSDDDNYARGMAYYRSLFEGAGSSQLRGESSTHYTKLPTYPKALTRMREHLPALKLIYVMRHPIDRLVSHYIHEWSMRNINVPIDRAVDLHEELVHYGCYHMQLQPFIQVYGRANVLPVFLERLQAESQSELERVCRFLGYQGAPIWASDLANQNVSSERLRLGKWGRELFDNPTLTRWRRQIVPQFVRDTIKDRLTMHERPQLSADKQAALRARFDADLKQLGNDLGAELDCENFRASTRERSLDWVV